MVKVNKTYRILTRLTQSVNPAKPHIHVV